MPSLKLLMLGFAAGFIATLIFHQGLWYIFNQVGVIPLDRPAWAMDSTPPFEIPAVLSKAFWGGLWGLVLTSILMHLDGELLGSMDRARRRGADGCCVLRRAAAERPADPGIVAPLLRGASAQWSLGLRHRAAFAAGWGNKNLRSAVR